MIRTQDKYYASLILGILTKPFDHQKAYTYGIIDADGKQVKKPENDQERESYTPLHILCFGIKRILDAFPGASNKVRLLSIAMNYIRNMNVPEQFREDYVMNSNNFLTEMYNAIDNNYRLVEEEILIESILSEEGEAPVNSTEGIDIHTPVINRMFKRKKTDE